MARPVLLTEEEAAAYLGLSPETLRRRRTSRINCPPFQKLGDGPKAPVRYREDKLVAWLDSLEVPAS